MGVSIENFSGSVDTKKCFVYLKKGVPFIEQKKENFLGRCVQKFRINVGQGKNKAAVISEAIFSKAIHSQQQNVRETSQKLLTHTLSSASGKNQLSRRQQSAEHIVSFLFQNRTSEKEEMALVQELAKDNMVEKILTSLTKKVSAKTELGQALSRLREKVAIVKIWEGVGLDPSVCETDYEGVNFLVKERLLYSIIGFQNSSAIGKSHEQLQVRDGKVYILCEGKFLSAASLSKRFRYVKEELQLMEQGTNKAWNYLCPDGLVPVDRCKSDTILPSMSISKDEKDRLLNHAKKMSGMKFSEEKPATSVLQIVTNPRKRFKTPDFFLFDGLESMTPNHLGFRIIDEKGNVYSSGFASTAEEDVYCTGKKNYFASINGMPGITDYEEFRPHDGRLVTSIPLTTETCNKELHELQEMRTRGVRFNILTQNCSTMANQLLRIAGIKLDNRVSLYKFLKFLLPHYSSLSFVDKIKSTLILWSHKFSKATMTPSAEEATSVIGKIIRVILTPLRLLTNFAANLILLRHGANKGSPVMKDMYGERKGEEGLKKFSAVISSAKDLFSDRSHTVHHSGPFIEWQLSQPTTRYYKYKEPNMNILPEDGVVPPKGLKDSFRRFQHSREEQVRKGELQERRKEVFRKVEGNVSHAVKKSLPKFRG